MIVCVRIATIITRRTPLRIAKDKFRLNLALLVLVSTKLKQARLRRDHRKEMPPRLQPSILSMLLVRRVCSPLKEVCGISHSLLTEPLAPHVGGMPDRLEMTKARHTMFGSCGASPRPFRAGEQARGLTTAATTATIRTCPVRDQGPDGKGTLSGAETAEPHWCRPPSGECRCRPV